MAEIKTITIEELNRCFDVSSGTAGTVVDIRTREAFEGGTYPGAVHVTVNEFDEIEGELPKKEPLYILCHTGERSREIARDLTEDGIEAYSVSGGYRAYLAWRLRRETELLEAERLQAEDADERKQAEDLPEASPKGDRALPENAGAGRRAPAGTQRQKEIERSIIKKFRKQLWCRFTKAVSDYQLIQEGDRIAVCISGGKDSMLMAKLIQEIWRHGKVNFEPIFLCMNPGYNEYNWEIIENNAKILGIPLTVFESNIFDAVANVEKNPCYLCARMRRGYLYNNAKLLGCNKIALGHHYDDVIETILMGILFAGKTETMMPKLHSQHFAGMELIRPLYLIREESIKAWRDYNDLHFIQCACRFTDTCSVQGGETSSKRAYVKELIRQMAAEDPVVEANIFNCVRDINLRTVIGYHKDQEAHNFLDDYEAYRNV